MYSEDSFNLPAERKAPRLAPTTAYLLGLSHTPPAPDARRLLVAAFYAQMNNPSALVAKAFMHLGKDDIGKCAPAYVHVRVPLPPGGAISTRLVSFEREIDPEDFFNRVCAYAGIEQANAHLGYKWNFERRTDPVHRLLTRQDQTEAFAKAILISTLNRHKKKVIMKIMNLENAIENVVPPNCSNARKKARKILGKVAPAPARIRIQHKPPFQPVANMQDHSEDTGDDTEPDSDYEHSLTVFEVLDAIDVDAPSLNICQYKEELTLQGILYAQSIFDFDKQFYVDIVKMSPSAVDFLIKQAKSMVRERRSKAKGKKRMINLTVQ